MTQPVTYLSQGISYLGFLQTQLRDLQGWATLTNELIQNADDATGATSMTFDVCDDALIVANDADFSACVAVDAPDCAQIGEPPASSICDFHRFRQVANGGKREQSGTTGAFGIGFISVYQITDRPQLECGNRKWVLRPEELEDQRIAQTLEPTGPGTRFVLPWAYDSDTQVRKGLRQAAVPHDAPAAFTAELQRIIPTAILFLRHLHRIIVKRNGTPILQVHRTHNDGQFIIRTEAGTQSWWRFYGEFGTEAMILRVQHRGRIEEKRTPKVTLAFPTAVTNQTGVFCATLPTQHSTGLPFHINADFFPSTDRKRILLDKDYQGDWNRAAITAAARIMTKGLPTLRLQQSPQWLWGVIDTVRRVGQDAKNGKQDQSLSAFWDTLKPGVKDQPIVWLSTGQWCRPDEGFLLEHEEEVQYLAVLEQLGLPIVHPSLRQYFPTLSEIGLPRLRITDMIAALHRAGLTHPIPLTEAPAGLQSGENRQMLLQEIEQLLRPVTSDTTKQEVRQQLAACALARSLADELCPPNRLFQTDTTTVQAFAPFCGTTWFLHHANPALVADLTPSFELETALHMLEQLPATTFAAAWATNPASLLALLDWFMPHIRSFQEKPVLAERLRRLLLWPAADGQLHPLDEIGVPGKFSDPLHIALLIAAVVSDGRGDFLQALGVRELTLHSYVTVHVPQAFAQSAVPLPQLRALIQLLAQQLGNLQDDPATQAALAGCPLIECTDGQTRRPVGVYLAPEAVAAILGTAVPIALLPVERAIGVRQLYSWLGVAAEPRPTDILARVDHLRQQPPIEGVRTAMVDIVEYLASVWDRTDPQPEAEYERLRTLAWLPAVGNRQRWFPPHALTSFSIRSYCESVAEFLDVPTQSQTADWMAFLGIRSSVTVELVVQHLLTSSRQGTPVLGRVLEYLNNRLDDPAIARLRGTACVPLDLDGHYARPDQVFWDAHPFGPYRVQISSELYAYEPLFSILGVRRRATAEDAIAALQELAATVNPDPADSDIASCCWEIIGSAYQAGTLNPTRLNALGELAVVSDSLGVLRRPREVFLEDRTDLTALLDPVWQAYVIPRRVDTWRVLAATGVRPLNAVLRPILHSPATRQPDVKLTDLLRTRRSLLRRVLDHHADGNIPAGDLTVLDSLQIVRADRLEVHYQFLPTAEAAIEFSSKPVSVFYHAEEAVLYYQAAEDFPWGALARELASVLQPNMEPGRMAATLRDVLRAATAAEAARDLSDLGFPALAADPGVAPEGAHLGNLPGALDEAEHTTGDDAESAAAWVPLEDVTSGRVPEPAAPPLAPPTNREQGPPSTYPPLPPPHKPTADLSPRQVDGGDAALAPPTENGEAAQPPMTSPLTGIWNEETDTMDKEAAEVQPDSAWVDESRLLGRSGIAPHAKSPPRRQRLRSYVLPPDYLSPFTDDTKEAAQAALRAEVDRAGIARVMQYEVAAGRAAEEMPVGNPGFDIRSLDSADQWRRIEVKSLAGAWDQGGVRLSRTQFEEAQNHPAEFWLYVVEYALTPNAHIWCIPDPATLADQFLFDNGWKDVVQWLEGSPERPPFGAVLNEDMQITAENN